MTFFTYFFAYLKTKKKTKRTGLKARKKNEKRKHFNIGRAPEVMNHVKSVVESENYETHGVFTDEEAIRLIKEAENDYFMIGRGITEPVRGELIALAQENNLKILEPNKGEEFNAAEFHELLAKANSKSE